MDMRRVTGAYATTVFAWYDFTAMVAAPIDCRWRRTSQELR